MPFDGRGNFSRLHRWEDDRINGIEIVTDHMDEEHDNFAEGLSQCFLKNGLSTMQNDFDAGNFKVRNIANGTTDKDAVNKSQLDSTKTNLEAFASALMPTGVILPYSGTTAPTGFLMCDGSAVSRTTYADLFAVIGTTYGSGDGSTTFNLPNSSNIVIDVDADVPIKGTGKTLGLTNGTDNGGLTNTTDSVVRVSKNNYNVNVSTSEGSYTPYVKGQIGITTDATKSGMVGTVTKTVLTCKHIIKY